MLGKLLKYEIRSTSRIFLILYPAILLLALLNKLLFFILEDIEILEIPRALMMMIYIFLIIGVFIITTLSMIQRFYKNLLGEEGYLMHTLPIKPVHLILSKLITTFMWYVGSTVVSLLSVLILVPEYSWIKEIPEMYRGVSMAFQQQFDENLGLFIALIIICCILSVIFFALQTYTAMAIGNLANKNKVFASFGAYVGLYITIQTITLIVIGITNAGLYSEFLYTQTLTTQLPTNYIIISALVSLVLSVGMFFATNALISKKLNLE